MSKHLIKDIEFVECPYCSKSKENQFKLLHWKHLKGHGKTTDILRQEFPDVPTMTLKEYNRRLEISKMGSEATKESVKSGKRKIVRCYYHGESQCSNQEFDVPIYDPNFILCENCKRFGKENPDGRTKEEANSKRASTFMKKYGVENANQIPEVSKKINETNLERYGGTGFESPELYEKIKQRIQEKFNSTNYMKSQEGRLRFVGENNSMNNPETRKKVSESLLGHPSSLKGKTYIEIHGEEKAKQLIEQKKISGAESCSKMNNISKPQRDLYNMIQKIIPEAKLNHPKYGYCLDIAIPELKIYFEYDGSYWHNKEHDLERDYILEQFGWKGVRFIDYLPSEEELLEKINYLLS